MNGLVDEVKDLGFLIATDLFPPVSMTRTAEQCLKVPTLRQELVRYPFIYRMLELSLKI